jgi:hypothetical protein
MQHIIKPLFNLSDADEKYNFTTSVQGRRPHRPDYTKYYEVIKKMAKIQKAKLQLKCEVKINIPDNQYALTYNYFIDFDKFNRQQDIPKHYFEKVSPDKTIFISHRWVEPDNPDPDRSQFLKVKDHLSDNVNKTIWFDYSCMPQKPRSTSEEITFTSQLHTLDDLLACCPMICFFDKSYTERSWCVAELIMSSNMLGFKIGDTQASRSNFDLFIWPLLIALNFEDVGLSFVRRLIDIFIDETKVTNNGDKELIKNILFKYMCNYKPIFLDRLSALESMADKGEFLVLGNYKEEVGLLFLDLVRYSNVIIEET